MSIETLIANAGTQADITVETPDGQPVLQDAMGGVDRSGQWPTVIEGVPCLVRTRSVSLANYPGRNDARANIFDTRIYFASDPVPSGISSRHRITVTQQGTGGKRVLGVYAVQGCIDPNSMGELFQVDCERIRTP